MTWPLFTYSPSRTLGGCRVSSTWPYQVTSSDEWAMITIHAGSYGLRPAHTTRPAPAARIGVYMSLARSIPWWKWAQFPTGGSHENPVQPYSCVTRPAMGHARVPLYCDGMPP